MLVSNEVIEWALQQGWEPIPVEDPCYKHKQYKHLHINYDKRYDAVINDYNDIEYFITEDGEPDYWYGVPIPETQGYKQVSPEEMVEMYNYYILCCDAPTPGNL
jgi:hypothetical protein